MSRFTSGCYDNHLHFFNTCRKMVWQKEPGLFLMIEKLLWQQTLAIYNLCEEKKQKIEGNNLRFPTAYFTFQLKNCNDINDFTVLLEHKTPSIIEDYKKLITMDKETISTIYDYQEYSRSFYSTLAMETKIYGHNRRVNGKKEFIPYRKDLYDDIENLENKSGVYFLYDEEMKLSYIGKSYDLAHRILTSSKERVAYFFSYALIKNKCDTDMYEIYYIALYKPKLNSTGIHKDVSSFTLPELKHSSIKPLFDCSIQKAVK